MKMKNVNSVHLVGRLGADPTESVLASGAKKARVRLATDNGSGTEPTWHSVVAWNGAAEKLMGAAKGHKVSLEGRLRKYTWEDSAQQTRSEIEIVAFDVKAAGAQEPGLNSISLLGHLSKDIRIAATKSGRTVATYTIVTNRAVPKVQKPQSREDWDNEATFHDCVAFDGLAESLKGLPKGSPVFAQGQLVYRRLAATDKYPEKLLVEVHASETYLVEPASEDPNTEAAPAPTGTDGPDW